MTQDLFVQASVEEQQLISEPIPKGESLGVDWCKLKEMWLAALSNHPISNGGWALFMSVDNDHPKFMKGPRKFDIFLLSQGEHPVWSPRCDYRSVFNSSECPGWAEFSADLEIFYHERPTDLPFGFNDEVEWFVGCMINKIALETMQRINWLPINSTGSKFSSPNTGQDIYLSPLHPSGGHLFAATRHSTYEEAINFSMIYSQRILR